MEDKKKPGRGSNPRSRRNLKPIQKGEVRNPEGGRAHDAGRRALKKLTSEYMGELLNVVVMGNLEDLKLLAEDPETPNLQKAAARCFFKAMENKDWSLVEKMIERLIGKVPDKVDATSNGQTIGGSLRIEFVDDGLDEK